MVLSGWKTYVAATLGVIFNGLVAMGYLDPNLLIPINGILSFLGLGFLRAGVKKGR